MLVLVLMASVRAPIATTDSRTMGARGRSVSGKAQPQEHRDQGDPQRGYGVGDREDHVANRTRKGMWASSVPSCSTEKRYPPGVGKRTLPKAPTSGTTVAGPARSDEGAPTLRFPTD